MASDSVEGLAKFPGWCQIKMERVKGIEPSLLV